jgi:hypothetical protein
VVGQAAYTDAEATKSESATSLDESVKALGKACKVFFLLFFGFLLIGLLFCTESEEERQKRIEREGAAERHKMIEHYKQKYGDD